jgi:hypothetical protein
MQNICKEISRYGATWQTQMYMGKTISILEKKWRME